MFKLHEYQYIRGLNFKSTMTQSQMLTRTSNNWNYQVPYMPFYNHFEKHLAISSKAENTC